jgi:hypothetical protein
MMDTGSGYSILILLVSCLQNCTTYIIAVILWETPDDGQRIRMFHPDPVRKLSAELYYIYHCCSTVKNSWWWTEDKDVPSWSCSQAICRTVWHIPLLCVQWKTPDDGLRNFPQHVEFHSKNKFEKLVHLVGFIIQIPYRLHRRMRGP